MVVLIFFIIAFLLYLIIRAAQNTRFFKTSSSIGKLGESDVAKILRSLPKEYLVINDVIIPDQKTISKKRYTTQIDHVVISPFGIFVIETKNYSGWIFGEEKSKQWKESFKSTSGHYFYNPIKQNWGHIYALAEYLNLNVSVFRPVIAFSNNCELHVITTTPVVYLSQLKNLILNYTQEIIPQGDVTLIYNRLNKLNLIGEEIEKKHIHSIGERLTEKEFTLSNGKCPRCGGDLILRNGKYGAFYGCSNYPKCKFTHNMR